MSGTTHIAVNVPTETGSTAVVDVVHDHISDTYTMQFSGALLDQAPEALTAGVQLALLEVAACRR